nr:hypothetical protein Iba_chr08dCG15740 [Ipomoea batatas]
MHDVIVSGKVKVHGGGYRIRELYGRRKRKKPRMKGMDFHPPGFVLIVDILSSPASIASPESDSGGGGEGDDEIGGDLMQKESRDELLSLPSFFSLSNSILNE